MRAAARNGGEHIAGRKGAYLLRETCGLHVSQQIAPAAVRSEP